MEKNIQVSRGGVIVLMVSLVIAIMFLTGTCAVAFAEEAPSDAVPVLKGEPAPFDGVLLPSSTLEQLLRDKAELQRYKAESNACQTELSITNELYEERVRKLTAQLDPGFWRQPEVQRWIGFALGVAVTGAAVWGAGQLE